MNEFEKVDLLVSEIRNFLGFEGKNLGSRFSHMLLDYKGIKASRFRLL